MRAINRKGHPMSMRTSFVSMISIDLIRDAIGCGNQSIVEALIKRRNDALRKRHGDDVDEDPEFRHFIESMLLCSPPPAAEPGCWNYVVTLLAEHLGLAPDNNLPFNEGFKHLYTWGPYREELAGQIPEETDRLLEYIEDGRPLKGKQIDHDGCSFAWLTPAETSELYAALSAVDADEFADEDLEDVHELIVESLEIVCGEGAALFVAAH